jgi:hypothetical protein
MKHPPIREGEVASFVCLSRWLSQRICYLLIVEYKGMK